MINNMEILLLISCLISQKSLKYFVVPRAYTPFSSLNVRWFESSRFFLVVRKWSDSQKFARKMSKRLSNFSALEVRILSPRF